MGVPPRAQPSDVSFMVRSSVASPPLFLACATGRHLKQGIFVIETAGEQPFGFYTLTLTDVLVSSFQASGSSEVPTDSFSLAFRTLRIKEIEQSPKGGIGAVRRGRLRLRPEPPGLTSHRGPCPAPAGRGPHRV